MTHIGRCLSSTLSLTIFISSLSSLKSEDASRNTVPASGVMYAAPFVSLVVSVAAKRSMSATRWTDTKGRPVRTRLVTGGRIGVSEIIKVRRKLWAKALCV